MSVGKLAPRASNCYCGRREGGSSPFSSPPSGVCSGVASFRYARYSLLNLNRGEITLSSIPHVQKGPRQSSALCRVTYCFAELFSRVRVSLRLASQPALANKGHRCIPARPIWAASELGSPAASPRGRSAGITGQLTCAPGNPYGRANQVLEGSAVRPSSHSRDVWNSVRCWLSQAP